MKACKSSKVETITDDQVPFKTPDYYKVSRL